VRGGCTRTTCSCSCTPLSLHPRRGAKSKYPRPRHPRAAMRLARGVLRAASMHCTEGQRPVRAAERVYDGAAQSPRILLESSAQGAACRRGGGQRRKVGRRRKELGQDVSRERGQPGHYRCSRERQYRSPLQCSRSPSIATARAAARADISECGCGGASGDSSSGRSSSSSDASSS
jgi:hypothetical protein